MKRSNPRIRLPITVVVLSPVRNRKVVDRVDGEMGSTVRFWGDIGIDIQPTVRAHQTPSGGHENWGVYLHDLHRWEIGTPKPTFYVMSELEYIVNLGLGAAWPHLGLAVVAGRAPKANVSTILDHELGHLLGLGHTNGTFMRSALELVRRDVSTMQKLTILENAHRLGGF